MDLQNPAFQNQSALHIRLDTSKILENIELYLRGMRIVIQQDPKTKKISSQKIPTGKRKANDSGVQSILSYVTAIINPQVVQGNRSEEHTSELQSQSNLVC